jgi:hypothetical protein
MKLGRTQIDRLIAWSPVALLGALAVLTYWLNAQVQVIGPAFDGSGRHDPDLYIENVKAVSLDAQGRVRASINAVSPSRFFAEFEAPASSSFAVAAACPAAAAAINGVTEFLSGKSIEPPRPGTWLTVS